MLFLRNDWNRIRVHYANWREDIMRAGRNEWGGDAYDWDDGFIHMTSIEDQAPARMESDAMNEAYEPRESTRIGRLVAAMRAAGNPKRLWSPQECAAAMGLKPRQVSNFTAYAAAHGVVFRTKIGKAWFYSLQQLDESEAPQPAPKRAKRGAHAPKCRGHYEQPLDDIRIPKVVPGFQFPKMVAPRAGGGL